MQVIIRHIEKYIPRQKITNECVEERIRNNGFRIPKGILEAKMGCNVRYYAAPDEQSSDLAVKAAQKVLEKFPKEKIDLMIFSAASGDLVEPATANIVQTKLGLSCPAFDLKNACNSVVNAIEAASAMIKAGQYKNVLIVSGEKPSVGINYNPTDIKAFKGQFASYSFGDAGAALLLGATEENKGFIFQKHQTYGEYWPLCTIEGGGTMYTHEPMKMYFTGQTYKLKHAFTEKGLPFVKKSLSEAGYKMSDIDLICTHQVSMGTYDSICESLLFDHKKIVKTFQLYGNTAATSLPLAVVHAYENNLIKSGDLILLLGMAAGINISVQLMRA